MTTNEGPGRTIQSAEITLNIISELQTQDATRVTALANRLGHSKSTIHNHLHTLEDQQLVVREDGEYRLSLRILDMAMHVREQIGNYDVIRNEADALAEETGEIIQFGIEEHGKVSYLYKATGEQAVETLSGVGKQQPMHSTSLGKTILAYLPQDRTERLIESMDLERFTSNTITSADALRTELEEIRQRGYGIDDEENIEGLRCVSAPVENGDTVLGAISITGPLSRFTDDRIHGELSELATGAANVIELNTKFSG
ncbi:IclR family transcriptional regulator [Haloarcula mannanilytica]|uniref:IclR family transcriptional regulator n=1 Tax=Haloarcula mannanilytica TaxID=2509225 RepID=A0A4C2EMY3_9EURY|nr:IclR family transcriptional regulator [Haloarcula mannanilytica]GCF15871.1 IclR family transcriptional regulator [Haloarcula mannanilytica]